MLILLLDVGGFCLEFAKGGDANGRYTKFDCYHGAITTTVQLQKRDSNAKPNKILKEEPRNIALSDQYDNINISNPKCRNNRLLNLRLSMPSQYTVTSSFHTARVTAVECAVPNTSAFQQIATSAMHQSGEPRQPLSSTDISLMQTECAESEINVLHWYAGADGDPTSIEMSTSESALQQESDTRTSAALAKAIMPQKSAANRTAELQANKNGKKQSKLPRFSSTESVVSV